MESGGAVRRVPAECFRCRVDNGELLYVNGALGIGGVALAGPMALVGMGRAVGGDGILRRGS